MIRPRTILATAAVVLGALALSACTSSPQADPPGSAPPGGTSTLPDPTDSEAPVDNPSTPAGLEAVDLGLSVRWANMNVGAEAPTDHGSYFGWGDTTGTNASTNDDDFPFANPPASISGTEQDAAHVHWGDGWRMPTHDEQMELVEQCDWQSDPQGDVPGWTITCPNGNSIFLTAGGGKIGDQTSTTSSAPTSGPAPSTPTTRAEPTSCGSSTATTPPMTLSHGITALRSAPSPSSPAAHQRPACDCVAKGPQRSQGLKRQHAIAKRRGLLIRSQSMRRVGDPTWRQTHQPLHELRRGARPLVFVQECWGWCGSSGDVFPLGDGVGVASPAVKMPSISDHSVSESLFLLAEPCGPSRARSMIWCESAIVPRRART